MAKFRRVPLKSIDEFKWHTRIIKTFGKKALLIYTAFPRSGAAVDESEINRIAADAHSAEEIMKFMLDNGLIEPDEGGAAPVSKEAKEKPEEEPEPAKPPKAAPARPSWKKEEYEEEKPIEPEISPEDKEEGIAPAEAAEKEEEIRPEGEEEAPAKEEAEEEIKPEVEEEAPAEEHEIEAEAPKKEEEEGIQPEEEHEAEAAPAEEEAKPEMEAEAAPEEESIRSEQEAPAEEEAENPNLTPAEMIVHDKYGEQGVLIFRLIDGKRSVADVAKESGATQDRVMEVLKYLDEVGLISLGGPGAGGAETGSAAAAPEEKFAPLEEEKEEYPLTIDEQKEGIKLAKTKPGAQFISKMKTKMEIVFKFGKSGREILDYLDARKEADSVRLATKLSIPINTVENVLSFLKAENVVELGFMQRDEIKKEFGYDAYIMYKRYGKKGVMFYEVIDKEMPLKKIAELISEKDPARIIEIFKLIRDVLGIDLPINEDAIKKDLAL
jgi:hypothetical protein